MKCDFCGGPLPDKHWLYPAHSFVLAGVNSLGEWAACDECARFIEMGDWSLVAERHPSPRKSDLRKIYALFVAQRTGEPYRKDAK